MKERVNLTQPKMKIITSILVVALLVAGFFAVKKSQLADSQQTEITSLKAQGDVLNKQISDLKMAMTSNTQDSSGKISDLQSQLASAQTDVNKLQSQLDA